MSRKPKLYRWHVLFDLLGDPTEGAEVGVYDGRLSRRLLHHFPKLTLHMIDAWDANAYTEKLGNMPNMPNDVLDEKRKTAIAGVRLYGDRAHIHHTTSEKAAAAIADDSLDFVFIDADHSYKATKQDIELWSPKVKPGGLISGHDYGRSQYGVTRAVDEIFTDVNTAANYVWYVYKERS